ncbi:hypothetical protein EDD29_2710 [Actinocorallia herbida]|uniref:Uncharacterized protein n=1 Tax=Actinocorallia herbida TaxID=58109 RepID=A0A3N1CV29_9ACTN|nr:hypothetical protein [Actinocorallia herbida]ROO85170.1 hypothetical protein EDD29_2710 [Actinocorallia herbida]
MFRAYLEREFAFKTFQNPEKIQEGFAVVSTVKLWLRVAEILTEGYPEAPVTADSARAKIRDIARRRNNIAHTADHDPGAPAQKLPVTAREAEETIDWLESIADAIRKALGEPAAPVDYDSAPSGAEALDAIPRPAEEPLPELLARKWDEDSLLDAIHRYCSDDVARTLLAVYRHAERHPAFSFYYYGAGKYPSVTAWFSLGSDEAAVWSIFTDVNASVLSINFDWMRRRGASDESMGRLADDLSVLSGWGQVPNRLRADEYARRPSLQPTALALPTAADTILDALDAFLGPAHERV